MGSTRIRIVGVVIALVAAGCSWTTVGHDGGHSFSSPGDRTVTPENVAGLHELWKGTGTGASAPVAADGRVFTVQSAASGRELAAYAAPGCGTALCAPTWTQPAAGTPLLAGGQVIARSESVVPTPTCPQPLPPWYCYSVDARGGGFAPATGDRVSNGVHTADQYPVVSEGVSYHWTVYTTQLRPPSPPAAWRLDETNLDGSGTTSRIDQFSAPVPYAVSGGSIYLLRGSLVEGYLKDSPNGCGMNFGCHPTWSGTVAQPTPFDGLLTAANGLVYISDLAGGVEVFDANGCGTGAGPCSPLWAATAGSVHVGQLAVTDTTLFAPSDDGHLYAFPAKGCGSATCAPLWRVNLGSPVHAPAVAGSMLYAGADDGRLVAIDARGCGSASCSPLKTLAVGAAVRTPLAISDGRIAVVDGNGTLHAFGLK